MCPTTYTNQITLGGKENNLTISPRMAEAQHLLSGGLWASVFPRLTGATMDFLVAVVAAAAAAVAAAFSR